MKKLYIPTSTLNLNNILSSESISPKAFYSRREFGYGRWKNIEENNYDNAIILYDKLCRFSRPKSDLEDHPLLIEVCIDAEKLKQINSNTFYCDHTIYLTPTTTRFIFFSEEDKKIALSMTNGSLETKMVKLYENCFCIEQPNETYTIEDFGLNLHLNESEIESDFKLNKMKGLLYGYYIGALLSTDISKVKRLNSLYEVDSIFAAINSSRDRIATKFQEERLYDILPILLISEQEKQDIENLKMSPLSGKSIITLSRIFSSKNAIDRTIDGILHSLTEDTRQSEEEIHPTIKWIKKQIEDCKKDIWANRKYLSTCQDEIIIVDNAFDKISTIDKLEASMLFANWINKIIIEKKYNGKISIFKKEFADNITICAKEMLSDKWDDSNITKRYLNNLRRHIAGEEFKEKFNNGILSSMAAVVIAGEEWNVLLRFMQKNEMTDYKIAFAIYGALNGFANLTRDFTDILLEQDYKYVNDVYKEFHGQLHGDDCGDIFTINQSKEATITGKIGHGIKNFSQKIKNAFTPEEKCENNFAMPSDKINITTPNEAANTPEILKPFFASKEFTSLTEEAQKFAKPKVIELFNKNRQTIDNAFTESLTSIDFPKQGKKSICTKTDWKKCLKYFEPKKTTQKKQSFPPLELPLYPFVEDLRSFEYIKQLLPQNNDKLVKRWENDFKYFQDNYKPTYIEKENIREGKYKDYPKDNQSVISNYKAFCENRRDQKTSSSGKDMKWVYENYENIDIESIIKKLNEIYK